MRMSAPQPSGSGSPRDTPQAEVRGRSRSRNPEKHPASSPAEAGSDNEGRSSRPKKKLKLASTPDVEEKAASGEEGEVMDSAGESGEPSMAPPNSGESSSEPTKASKSWNRGINSGLRTSFGKNASNPPSQMQPQPPQLGSTSQTLPAKLPVSEAQSPTDVEVSAAEMAPDDSAGSTVQTSKKKAATRKLLTTFKHGDLEWQLPSIREEDRTGVTSWRDRFGNWCEDFLAKNTGYDFYVSNPVLLGAFEAHVKSTSVKGKKLKSIMAAAANFMTTTTLEQLVAAVRVTNAAPDPERKQEPSASEWASLLETPDGREKGQTPTGLAREAELREIQKYFPGVPADAVFCVCCSRSGHRAAACPEKTCKFCKTTDHTVGRCPTRQRCKKCKQLGHTRSTCQEKLALAPGEADECAFCASPHHLEGACTVFPRSHRAEVDHDQKVQSIPAYCYFCGSDKHFGGDCAKNKGVHLSGRAFTVDDGIWSAAIRDMYIDAASDILPIAWVPPLPPLPPPPAAPTILGRSIVPRTHIPLPESDDEGEGAFIREPVQGHQATSRHIRFTDLTADHREQGSVLQNGSTNKRGNPRDRAQNGQNDQNGRRGRAHNPHNQYYQGPALPGSGAPTPRASQPPVNRRDGAGGRPIRRNVPESMVEYPPPSQQSQPGSRGAGGGRGRGGRGRRGRGG